MNKEDLREYRRLLAESKRSIQLDNPEPSHAFLNAGKRIVDECKSIIAVWDGEPSKGLGGTADIVEYARSLERSLTILNPITRKTTWS